jgi:hypothetical protein
MSDNAIRRCTPDGIRVWRGFRSRSFFDNRSGFDSIVGSIFVPQTAQQMEPLGLRAYFPALLPDSIPPGSNDQFLKIPDEVALVVYPSKEEYQQAVNLSVSGRAYSLLHWPVFNGNDPEIPPSRSGHPEPWSGALNWDQPCYLAPDAIDWRSGVIRLLVARPLRNIEPDDFLQRLNDIIRGWLLKRDANFDGAIICASHDYLLYWEHRAVDTEQGSLLPLLLGLLEAPYLNSAACPVIVPPAFHQPDTGVAMKAGDFLDVRVDVYR